jgi:hypothetical protein
MTMRREGGCFCGAVRYRTEGESFQVTHCHCLHCRRTSGAAFVTWAEFPADTFSWKKGAPGTFSSRPGALRTFCTACGTPLTFVAAEDTPPTVDVTVCSFDDPSPFSPESHIWCDRQLPWIHLDDGLPRHPLRRQGS